MYSRVRGASNRREARAGRRRRVAAASAGGKREVARGAASRGAQRRPCGPARPPEPQVARRRPQAGPGGAQKGICSHRTLGAVTGSLGRCRALRGPPRLVECARSRAGAGRAAYAPRPSSGVYSRCGAAQQRPPLSNTTHLCRAWMCVALLRRGEGRVPGGSGGENGCERGWPAACWWLRSVSWRERGCGRVSRGAR